MVSENGDDKTIVIIDENQSMENPAMKPMTANDALTVVVTGSPVGATAFIQVVVGFPFVAVASHTFFILIGSPANIFNPTTDNYLKVESGESSAHHKGKSTCDGQSGISPAMVKQLVALGAALGASTNPNSQTPSPRILPLLPSYPCIQRTQ